MENYWDAFISAHEDELTDLSLRETLEKFYRWLDAKGVVAKGKKPKTRKSETTRPAVLIEWIESEQGWGQRPDGATLHATQEEANIYVKEYWAKMPTRDAAGRPPEIYWRPVEPGSLVLVDAGTWSKIQEGAGDHGIRIGEQTLHEWERKGHIRKQP